MKKNEKYVDTINLEDIQIISVKNRLKAFLEETIPNYEKGIISSDSLMLYFQIESHECFKQLFDLQQKDLRAKEERK